MGYPRTVPAKSNPAPKSLRESRSDPLASSPNLTPNPQSQFFSQIYGSILPTFLTYIVLLTRGCSPRRPAVVMSMNARENQSFPRIFKGLQECTRHQKKCGALLTINLSPGNQILWCQVVNKKRELFPGLLSMSPSSVALPQIWAKRSRISMLWFGNIDTIPFR